jgi:type IV secretion system protein VirB3
MRNRDIIFKGATRPAMMMGVPIVPLILVAGIDMLLAVWSIVLFSPFCAFVILAGGVVAISLLRYISSQDDQRLSQYILRWKNVGARRTTHYWGAHAISPIDFDKRKRRL